MGAVSCAAEAEDGARGDGDEATEMDASDLASRTIRLRPGATSFTLRQTRAQDVTLTIDSPPACES